MDKYSKDIVIAFVCCSNLYIVQVTKCRGLGGSTREVLKINDNAHHSYFLRRK